MIFICVLFGFSLIYWYGWSEKQFCENVSDKVLLKPFIMSRRTCFVLSGVSLLLLKYVLDLWYSGYFLFLALGKLWKMQEDKAP